MIPDDVPPSPAALCDNLRSRPRSPASARGRPEPDPGIDPCVLQRATHPLDALPRALKFADALSLVPNSTGRAAASFNPPFARRTSPLSRFLLGSRRANAYSLGRWQCFDGSDPRMHRTQRGPPRVRMEAWRRGYSPSGGRIENSIEARSVSGAWDIDEGPNEIHDATTGRSPHDLTPKSWSLPVFTGTHTARGSTKASQARPRTSASGTRADASAHGSLLDIGGPSHGSTNRPNLTSARALGAASAL